MIGDILDIYKARRDPALASRLAARLARGQALDRAFAPLFVVHLVMWLIFGVCGVLVGLGLFGTLFGHWTVLIPTLIPAGLGYGLWRIHRGIRTGEARIRTLAETMTERGMDAVLPRRPRTDELDAMVLETKSDRPTSDQG